jgi:hypothetical protein
MSKQLLRTMSTHIAHTMSTQLLRMVTPRLARPATRLLLPTTPRVGTQARTAFRAYHQQPARLARPLLRPHLPRTGIHTPTTFRAYHQWYSKQKYQRVLPDWAYSSPWRMITDSNLWKKSVSTLRTGMRRVFANLLTLGIELFMFGAITYQTWSCFGNKTISERRDGEHRRKEITRQKHEFWTDEDYIPPKESLWRRYVKM